MLPYTHGRCGPVVDPWPLRPSRSRSKRTCRSRQHAECPTRRCTYCRSIIPSPAVSIRYRSLVGSSLQLACIYVETSREAKGTTRTTRTKENKREAATRCCWTSCYIERKHKRPRVQQQRQQQQQQQQQSAFLNGSVRHLSFVHTRLFIGGMCT